MTGHWAVKALMWDGLLPAVVVLTQWFARILFPRNDAVDVLAIILVPMLLAMVRTSYAHELLARHFGQSIPVLRQIGLAVAIVLLMMSEMMFGVQMGVPETEPIVLALMIWLAYFVVISASTSLPPEFE